MIKSGDVLNGVVVAGLGMACIMVGILWIESQVAGEKQ